MTNRLSGQHAIKDDILKHPFLKVYRMDQTEVGLVGESDYSLKDLLAK